MKRRLVVLGLGFLLLSPLFGCEKNNDVTAPGDPSPVGTGAVPDSLALARTFPPLMADGIATVLVEATVVDALGRGLAGVGVAFQTNRGTITPFATTDAAGRAQATLVSAASAADLVASVSAAASTSALPAGVGQTVVVVSRERLSQSQREQIAKKSRRDIPLAPAGVAGIIHDTALVPMTGITVSVVAGPSSIPADGITASHLVATVVETTRRVPIEGREVVFGTTAGVITGSATTDRSGAAAAELTALPGNAGSTVTVYFGRTLTAQTAVSFSPLRLSLTTESASLPADGVSGTGVIAQLVNEAGNPVAGASVEFTTTLGTIQSPVVTDVQGEARAVLVAAATTGSAEVGARFGPSLSRSATVTFVAPPATARVLLRVEPGYLPADGASEARLVATALDGQSNPMPDGTTVTFSVATGGGRIIGPVRLTSGGNAEGIYVAGTETEPVTIQAASGASTASASVLLQSLAVGGITLTTDRASVLADGAQTATLTALVKDRFGHPVRPGTFVQFDASAGLISDVMPTDVTGTATARLRSVRWETGTGRVTAGVGDFFQTVDIRFVSEAAAHIEVVNVDPARIGVRGASDRETSTITYEVRDQNGIPVDAAHGVTLSFAMVSEGDATDASIYPAGALTNARGQVLATVNAGVESGAVRVDAVSGALRCEPVRVAIHGDLPDPSHFSVFSEKLNVAGRVFAGIQYRVTAKVGDQHGNPVPEETGVWFRTTHGVIQGSAFTGPVADATVIAETAGPFPNEDGFVTHTAQTISKDGAWIETSTPVLWSGPSQVEITSPSASFDIPNGGSVTISFTVSDDLGNPLVGGTSIKVTSTAGTLGGDTDVGLPDTQSQGYTHFSVVLSDDDTETNQAAAVTVSIKVTSQNGNRGVFLTGTKH